MYWVQVLIAHTAADGKGKRMNLDEMVEDAEEQVCSMHRLMCFDSAYSLP
jgi:hypothetical protein